MSTGAAGDPAVWLGVYSSPAADLSPITNDSDPVFHCPYCSPPWSATAPVKYLRAPPNLCADTTGPNPCKAHVPLKWQQSHGSHRFQMTNMGDDAMVVLFGCGQRSEWCIKSFGVLATATIPMSDKGLPRGIHLARTAQPDEMLVSWASPSKAAQHVEWQWVAASSGTMHSSLPAVATTYSREDVCGVPASTQGWADPQWLHHAVVKLPGNGQGNHTLVSYRVGSATTGWSPPNVFRPPKHPGPDVPLVAIAFADLGYSHPDGTEGHMQYPNSSRTTGHAAKFVEGADVVLVRQPSGRLSLPFLAFSPSFCV